MKVLFAIANELARGCWYVTANVGQGKVLYHNGPHPVADYFTEAQAKGLVARIEAAGNVIDKDHWYGDEDALDPEEYWAQMYEWEEMEKEAGRW